MRVKRSREVSGLRRRTAFLLELLFIATLCAHEGFAVSQAPKTAADNSAIRLITEIDDVQLSTRWILRGDPAHPGGPGVMTPERYSKGVFRNTSSLAVAAQPVIHGGDQVIVEEKSAVVEARLVAIALGSATAGTSFQARLQIGGKVVRVMALGDGRAMLVPEYEVRR